LPDEKAGVLEAEAQAAELFFGRIGSVSDGSGVVLR
jgi:hypothetical protein